MQGLTQVRNEEIYLPDGRRLNVSEGIAARAVEAYDESLILGQLHGQWTVFLRNGPVEGMPFPVLGLGFELPGPDEVTKRLHMADTKRHGGKIAERVDRHNRERQRQLRAQGDDKVGEVAETVDVGLRLMKQHPTPRIFVPGDKS